MENPVYPPQDSDDDLAFIFEILHKIKDLVDAIHKKDTKIAPKSILSQLFSMTNLLENSENRPTPNEFRTFLDHAHNLFVTGDSSVRSSLLRVIRYCLPDKDSLYSQEAEAFAREIVAEEFHWLVISSFEREMDYAMERTQAFKLMGRLLVIAPQAFPISFARSLVAVANFNKEDVSKEDPFRKSCMCMLRDLALCNPRMVASVNGFSCLVDAVIEFSSPELAENILLSLMYLLNSATTRRIVQPCIDLRILLSPFTDLDTEPSKLSAKLQSAKSAIVLMMRSWVGVVMISSDEMALPTLVQMLRDPKVPVPTQDVILEAISEVLSPSDFKVRFANRARHQKLVANAKNSLHSAFPSAILRSSSSPGLAKYDMENFDGKRPVNDSGGPHHVRHLSDPTLSSMDLDQVAGVDQFGGSGIASANSQSRDREANFALRSFSKDTRSGPSQTVVHQQQFQLQQQQQQQSNGQPTQSKNASAAAGSGSPQSASRGITTNSSTNNLSSMLRLSTTSTSPVVNNPGEASKQTRSHMGLPFFNMFDRSSSPGLGKKKGLTNGTGNNTPVVGNASAAPPNGGNNGKVFATSAASVTTSNNPSTTNSPMTAIQRPIPKPAAAVNDFVSFGIMGFGNDTGSSTASRSRQSSTKSSPDIHLAAAAAVAASSSMDAHSSGALAIGSHIGQELWTSGSDEVTVDPIFNMMDNFTALLCSAFLHVDLIQSLYYLGIHGSMSVAGKSRKLMVKYLRILANIFPERRCSELLTIPSLIEFAAITNTSSTTNKAHKSSQILVSLAEAFSLMPYKQVTGKHISRPTPGPTTLSLQSNSISSPMNVGEKVNAFNPNPSRPKSDKISANTTNFITGKATAISSDKSAALSSTTVTGNSLVTFPANTISNLAPLNIETIFELAEEIKISSLCTISAANNYYTRANSTAGSSGGITSGIIAGIGLRSSISGSGKSSAADSLTEGTASSEVDIIRCLRASLTPSVDKFEFQRQMDQSKILHGKEPFKWDWLCISDTLEYSFHSGDRLNEALKGSKWMRRLCGFYRCSFDEKGYFANLDWEPTHLQYLECAFNLYTVLLQDEAGIQFLNSDRRGMLFVEIAQEIDLLCAPQSRIPMIGAAANASTKNVFRMFSCSYTMAREYFTILGRVMKLANARDIYQILLKDTNIYQALTKIGNIPALDYLSRLVFTSLSFTDCGSISRPLLQFWTTAGSCTPELRSYFHTILRVLIGSKPSEMYLWCVDAILELLRTEDEPSSALYKALEEVVHNKDYLRMVVAKRPKLQHVPEAHRILMRFLAIPEGFAYLNEQSSSSKPSSNTNQESSWLDQNVLLWQDAGSKNYANEVEEKMSLALSGGKDDRATNLRGLVPIPIQTPDFVGEILARQGGQASGYADDPNGALALDLHGLLRVPWNIEVKLTAQAGYQGASPDYLKVDAFLDLSELSSPFCFETTSDSNRLMRVRGIILDSKGLPLGSSIGQNRIISNTLMAGVSPITKEGRISSTVSGGSRARRRTSATAVPLNNARDSLVTNRSSIGGAAPGPNGESLGGGSDADVAITYMHESQYEWFHCKPGHRQGQLIELGDSKFAVAVPGEPVVWIFSRRAPALSQNATRARNASDSNLAGKRPPAGGRKLSLGSPFEYAADALGSNRDASRMGGTVYLLEVHYYFRLETGQALFVPMPRHLFGELSRTQEGCEYISQKKIVHGLIALCRQHPEVAPLSGLSSTSANSSSFYKPTQAQQQFHHESSSYDGTTAASGQGKETIDIRAAIWSLGHIGASELGFKLIHSVDSKFVEFCIHNACNCGNLSLRGTFFFVLGLFSRTMKGSAKLNQLQWEAAPFGSNSAVAIPKNPSALFQPLLVLSASHTPFVNSYINNYHGSLSASNSNSTTLSKINMLINHGGSNNVSSNHSNAAFSQQFISMQRTLTPFMTQQGAAPNTNPAEAELLNLISKLPGVIVYRDSKQRLDLMKKERPELFSKRSLFVEVLKILDAYTFKLTARREVLKLFTNNAKLK